MIIEWREEIRLSDKEVEILEYLNKAENNMYTWHSNDTYRTEHPFEDFEARGLVLNGFLRSGSDHNFGDRYVYLTEKGNKLLDLIEMQKG